MDAKPSPVFKETFRRYLDDLKTVDFRAATEILDIQATVDTAIVPVFGHPHRVSRAGIAGPGGKRPHFSVSIVLLKYLLLCPEELPAGSEWVSFKDIPDAAPLIGYFSSNVLTAVAGGFSGRLQDLKQAADFLGGRVPDDAYPYDLAFEFRPLPRVPVLLLFNDADDEFPAQCAVLFERRAERFLDPECLAIVGSLLVDGLKGAGV